MIEPMISPAEQGVVKHVVLVLGGLVIGGYIAVLFTAMVLQFKGDKDA